LIGSARGEEQRGAAVREQLEMRSWEMTA